MRGSNGGMAGLLPALTRQRAGTVPAAGGPGGVPLLPNELGPLSRLIVEVAWGAVLTADPATWSWTDVTTDVLTGDGGMVSFTYGRPDETSNTQAARATLTFLDPLGKYALGGYSPNYPNVRLGVPIRIRADVNGTGFEVLFQGNIVALNPDVTDASARVAYVEAELAGTIRRIEHPTGQGTPLSCPQRYMLSVSPAPVVYYPLTDGSLATFGRAAIASGPGQNGTCKAEVRPILVGVTASQYLGEGRVSTWLDEGASLKENAVILAFVPLTPYQTTQFVGGVVCSFASGKGTAGQIWEFGLSESASGVMSWALVADCGNRTVSIADGNTLVVTQHEDILFDGQPHFVQIVTTKSGSDTVFTGLCDGISFINYTAVGRSFKHVWSMLLANTDTTERSFAHLAAWVNGLAPNTSDATNQMLGANVHTQFVEYTEDALTRLAKLRTQTREKIEVIGATGLTSDTVVMGVQPTDDLLGLLRGIEAADQGLLYDGTGPGLTYVTRNAIENQFAALTVDVGTKQLYPGFKPVFDPSRIVNVAQATRLYGSTASYEQATGPLGTAAIGTYDSGSITVNTDSDVLVLDFAGWLVNLGTVEGYRYPEVSFSVKAAPALAYTLIKVRPGHRIDLTNVRSVFANHPLATVSLVVEGISMDITTAGDWVVRFQCSLYEPWRIFRVAVNVGDTFSFNGRLLPESSALAAPVAVGATSMSVSTPSGPVWTTDPDDFPISVLVGGILTNVTNVTGAGTTQIFTIDPMPTARPANAPVELYRPGVLRL